jgi:hypothetical protein
MTTSATSPKDCVAGTKYLEQVLEIHALEEELAKSKKDIIAYDKN